MKPQYTMSLVRKNNDLYGPVHGGVVYSKTICDREITEDWWILTNDWTGEITCKKCLSILRQKEMNVKWSFQYTEKEWFKGGISQEEKYRLFEILN